MDRLTTNKPVKEMGMVELAYNSCFAKDGEAYYRDFSEEISARDLARKLYKIYTSETLSDDDDTFDEEMIEELQYDIEVYPEALIALFYRNLWAMADLRETLARYEDLEERELLIKLPCKIGDTVYVKMQFGGYAKGEVRDFTYFVTCGFCVVVTSEKFDKINIPFSEFGKSIFLKEPQE